MRKLRAVVIVALCVVVMGLLGCGEPKETAEEKVAAFQKAHAAIYEAWKATTPTELQDSLQAGLAEPLLSQQIKQQSAVMQQRLLLSEKHIVKSITFNQVEILQDGKTEFTIAADWTVDGLIDHGDVHEKLVPYKKKFHVVKESNGVWKIDQMLDL